jgi:hypothetical protein
MKRLALAVAVAALLAGAVLAYAEISTRSGPDPAGVSKRIHLRGQVKGLYPGESKTLRVRIKNESGIPLIARRMDTRVRAAGPGCNPSNLAVGKLRRHRLIPPHRQRRVAVQVAMLPKAPEACQAAKFPLRFNARFRKTR